MKKRIICFISVIIVITIIGIVVAYIHNYNINNKKKYTSGTYEETLFDTSYVHKINIKISESNWEDLLKNPTEKTKYKVDATIDGNKIKNVSFSTKGNTSLTQVAESDSDRYSFKINFGKYVDGQTFYGLDKLNLNNTISDSTYMKDYMSYYILRKAGSLAPLCSYTELYINGKYHGLYLALEEVEDSFIKRYEKDTKSVLYKPEADKSKVQELKRPERPEIPERPERPSDVNNNSNMNNPTMKPNNNETKKGDTKGSDLVYKDDNFDSYSFIFDNIINKATYQNKKELINAIKSLSTGNDIEKYWDIDSIINFFVGHNYVLNFDSYTGPMLHNYYLLQDNNKVSFIPWDYNLSFGGLGDIEINSNSKSTILVNYPIDTPLNNTTIDERPLWKIISNNKDYLEKYHERITSLIKESETFTEEIDRVYSLIKDYVKKSPSTFYTYEEFEKGYKTLKEFCKLRNKSIEGQLNGTIGKTSDEQSKDSSKLIDASSINIDDMGVQGGNREKNKSERQRLPRK